MACFIYRLNMVLGVYRRADHCAGWRYSDVLTPLVIHGRENTPYLPTRYLRCYGLGYEQAEVSKMWSWKEGIEASQARQNAVDL